MVSSASESTSSSGFVSVGTRRTLLTLKSPIIISCKKGLEVSDARKEKNHSKLEDSSRRDSPRRVSETDGDFAQRTCSVHSRSCSPNQRHRVGTPRHQCGYGGSARSFFQRVRGIVDEFTVAIRSARGSPASSDCNPQDSTTSRQSSRLTNRHAGTEHRPRTDRHSCGQ